MNPINISELQPDTHHLGKVLFLRTIESSLRDAAIQSIVQDRTGTAERFAIYNADPFIKAEQVLPEHTILAVKEPYYAATGTGSSSIRVDHPSDVIRLSLLDQQVPREIWADLPELVESPLECKERGNAAYSARDYPAAYQIYSQGVDACGSEDTAIKLDLLRNRAAVSLFLKRFTRAEADAKAAIISTNSEEDEKAASLNAKAYERAGLAAYELGHFEEAEAYFKKMQELAPASEDAPRALKRIEQRLRERSNGDFVFETMSRSTSKKHNRLDHADFIINTTVSEAGGHGRGLFAAKSFTAGQLILCEKALCVAFDSDGILESYTILDPKTQRASTGTQATLLFSLVQKLLYSPELASEYFNLFDGGYPLKTSPQIVDGLVTVDAFRTQAIIQHNCFGCPTVRSSSKSAQKQSASLAGYYSTGFWMRASYINHACDGNAMRSFIGDMMVVRATRDIAEGEEILMPYRLPDAINAATQEELQKLWGFKCDCRICGAEAASTASQRKYRSQLIEKARNLLSSDKSKTAQVENIFAKLQGGYDERVFEVRPRLGLVALGQWLCQAYKRSGSRDKVIKTALALLRDLGFVVIITGKKISIDRQNSAMDGAAIDAAMYAAHAYRSRGDIKLGNQMEEFAKSLYLVMNGETRDFEERYKES